VMLSGRRQSNRNQHRNASQLLKRTFLETNMGVFGGIEGGGSKFVCGVGAGPDDVKLATFSTTSPDDTVKRVCEFFHANSGKQLDAVGIGSFGPVDLNPGSKTFGYITSTPKAGWQHFDLAGAIHRSLGVPVGFDTDVNAAALGEARWGAGVGVK